MQFVEIDDGQRLNFVNSCQLHAALDDARRTLSEYRHGMRWVQSKGKRYLVRLVDSKGYGRSLGVEDEKTHSILENFKMGKENAKTRYKSISEKVLRQARLNTALRMGRINRQAAHILDMLNKTNLSNDFIVVGTHALYAYEAMAGVYIEPDLLATEDLDFCFDARRPLKLITEKIGKAESNGLLGLLQKVDKSYKLLGERGSFRAVNDKGFMVDVITPQRDMLKNTPITFGTDDLIASEVPNLHWLVNAKKHREIVIAYNGIPLSMRVPDPRAFALHKAWLSQNPDRNPVKRERDRAQAQLVVSLIARYLPQCAFEHSQLKYLSKEMIQLATQILEPSHDESNFLDDLKFPDVKP